MIDVDGGESENKKHLCKWIYKNNKLIIYHGVGFLINGGYWGLMPLAAVTLSPLPRVARGLKRKAVLDALEAEIYRNLSPIYPNAAIRIRRSSTNGLQLSGVRLDEDKKRVMQILQQVWEDDSLLYSVNRGGVETCFRRCRG